MNYTSESHPELDPRHYAVNEILRDGTSIHIRAIRPDDKVRLFEHFTGLSPQSRYQRFFGTKRALTREELKALTELDFQTHVALVATLFDGVEEKIIGVGRYIVDKEPTRAEVAFAVLDEYQGRGIGTLLLDHLSRIARASGITEFEANVLAGNRGMLDVLGQSGFAVKRSVESGVVHVSLLTTETEQSILALEEREQKAAATSVARVLRPRSVAIIGASRDPRKIGGAILANMKRDGFTGPIYPINPSCPEVQGLKAFASVSEVGAPVDLAVITVPAPLVESSVADCARAGVAGVVVISSGFAEVSEQGREAQRRLLELARASGMRLIGPNCMGIINTEPSVSLNATFAPVPPPRGHVGMFSESGALGIAVLDYARARHLGVSTFVSGGNRADVSSNDLLAYWADDDDTTVIVLYLESFGNPRKFSRLAPAIARRKPIVAVKAGRTAAGTRAAQSHSAALASSDVGADALFEQAGVIRTNTLGEMFDVVTMVSQQPVPKGPRVGVVTNAGGPGILFADGCEARGLSVPQLAPKTLSELRSLLSERAGFANPIDMTANAGPAQFERTIALVGNDPNVDALVAIYIPPMVTEPEAAAAAIARGAGEVPPDKPVLTVFLSSAGAPAALNSGPRGVLPCYEFPENAVMALAAAYRYGRWLARPQGRTLTLSSFARATVRAVIDRVLDGASEPVWLAPDDLALVLRAAGIESARAERATVEDVTEAADRLGYPLVAKIIAPGIVHKTEVGGVIMGLENASEVAAAAATLAQRMQARGARLDGILLQQEVREGIEALVGVASDPIFGPLIGCGTGGVMAELMRDVSFRLHPVTDVDAAEMVDSVRLRRLLDGYRGAEPGDREALIRVIMSISALVEAVPELTELDLNPLKVLAPGKGAIVIDARMRVRPLGRASSSRRAA
jgi:acetyl coenzyme A synthetase (ADP forming)-like protein